MRVSTYQGNAMIICWRRFMVLLYPKLSDAMTPPGFEIRGDIVLVEDGMVYVGKIMRARKRN